MYTKDSKTYQTKGELYADLNAKLKALTDGEHDIIANLANASALLFDMLPQINWAGFYLLKDGQLVLGPFQGLPACIRIKLGSGVCGTSASENKIMLVEDVEQFPGHIACDARSKSEIVLPIHFKKQMLGVLDIDSPVLSRFDEQDKQGLEHFVTILENSF